MSSNNQKSADGGSRQRSTGAHRSERSRMPNEDIVSVTAGDNVMRKSQKMSGGQDSNIQSSEPHIVPSVAGLTTENHDHDLVSAMNEKNVPQSEMAFTHTLMKNQSPDFIPGQDISVMSKTGRQPLVQNAVGLMEQPDGSSDGTRVTHVRSKQDGSPLRRPVDIKATPQMEDVAYEFAVSPVRQMYPVEGREDNEKEVEINLFNKEAADTPQVNDQATGQEVADEAQHSIDLLASNVPMMRQNSKQRARMAGRYGVGGSNLQVIDSVLNNSASKKALSTVADEQNQKSAQRLFSKIQSNGMSSANRTSPDHVPEDMNREAGRTTRVGGDKLLEYVPGSQMHTIAQRTMQFQIPQKKDTNGFRDIYKGIEQVQRQFKGRPGETRNRLTTGQYLTKQSLPADIQITSYARDAFIASSGSYQTHTSRGENNVLQRTGSLESVKPLYMRRDFKQGLHQTYAADAPASVRSGNKGHVSLPQLGRGSQDVNDRKQLPEVSGSSLQAAGKTLLTTQSMERLELCPIESYMTGAQAYLAATGATPTSALARSLRKRGGSLSPSQEGTDADGNSQKLLQLAGKTFRSQKVLPPEVEALTQRLRTTEQEFMRIAQNSPEPPMPFKDSRWQGNKMLSVKINNKQSDMQRAADYFSQDIHSYDKEEPKLPDARVSVDRADFSIKISGGGVKDFQKGNSAHQSHITPANQLRRENDKSWGTSKLNKSRGKISLVSPEKRLTDRSARDDEYAIRKALEPIRAREQASLERERRAQAAALRRQQMSDEKDSSTVVSTANQDVRSVNVKKINKDASKEAEDNIQVVNVNVGHNTQQPSYQYSLNEPKTKIIQRSKQVETIHKRVDSLFERAEKLRAEGLTEQAQEQNKLRESGVDTALSDEQFGHLKSNYFRGTVTNGTEVSNSVGEPLKFTDALNTKRDHIVAAGGNVDGELLSFAESVTEETSQFKYKAVVSKLQHSNLRPMKTEKNFHFNTSGQSQMSSAPSNAAKLLTKLNNKKNNPHDRGFNQEKLLDTIKKQQDQLKMQRQTIERLEKDAARFRSEASAQKKKLESAVNKNDEAVHAEVKQRLDSLAQKTEMTSACNVLFNVDGNIEDNMIDQPNVTLSVISNGVLTPARRKKIVGMLASAGLPSDSLQALQKYLGEINQYLQVMHKQASVRDATVKRYRNMVNQQLSDGKKVLSSIVMSPEIKQPSYYDDQRGSFNAIAPFAVELSSLQEGDGLSNGQQDMAAGRSSLSPAPIPREYADSPIRYGKDRSHMQIYSSRDFDKRLSNSVSREKKNGDMMGSGLEYPKRLDKIAEGNEGTSEIYSTRRQSKENDLERRSFKEQTMVERSMSRTQMDHQSKSVSPTKHSSKNVIIQGAQKIKPTLQGLVTRSTSIKLPSPNASVMQSVSLRTKPGGGQSVVGFNHARMHHLMSIVLGARRAKNFSQLILNCLPEIDKIMNCKGAMFVLLDEKFQGEEDMKVYTRAGFSTHSQSIDGKQLYMVSTQEMAGADAAFKRFADAKYPVTLNSVLSHPICDYKGTVLATLQVQTRQEPKRHGQCNHRKGTLMPREASRTDNKSQSTYKGFPMIDQHTLQLLAAVFGLKLDETLAVSKNFAMRREVVDTIKLAGSICTQRSQPELVRLVKQHLPRYFGFQAVGIMFRDQKSDSLFTVNEISTDDTEMTPNELLMSTLTGPQVMTAVDKARARRKEQTQTQTITVPSSMGVTGVVVREKRVVLTNNVLGDKLYQGNVDNQTDVKEVQSLMVGPVFGHKNNPFKDEHPTEEALGTAKKIKPDSFNDLNKPQTAYKDIDPELPIGVIQLVNKLNGKPIDEYDKQKFEAIQTLVGLSIDNTQEYNSVLNIRVGLYKHLRELAAWLSKFHATSDPRNAAEAACDGSVSAISSQAMQSLSKARSQIDEMIKKLDKLREAAKLDELAFLIAPSQEKALSQN